MQKNDNGGVSIEAPKHKNHAWDMLDKCKLSLPLKIKGKELYDLCIKNGFTRYAVSRYLLVVSNTTGRTVSLSDEYEIKIDKLFNVSINKITSVK